MATCLFITVSILSFKLTLAAEHRHQIQDSRSSGSRWPLKEVGQNGDGDKHPHSEHLPRNMPVTKENLNEVFSDALKFLRLQHKDVGGNNEKNDSFSQAKGKAFPWDCYFSIVFSKYATVCKYFSEVLQKHQSHTCIHSYSFIL